MTLILKLAKTSSRQNKFTRKDKVYAEIFFKSAKQKPTVMTDFKLGAIGACKDI